MLPKIILFEGEDAGGTVSLWETDGTASGTFELGGPTSPLIAGEAGYGFAPNAGVSLNLTIFNNQVLFGGRSGPGAIGPFNLWTSDGTAAGTVALTPVVGASSSGIFTPTVRPGFTVFGNEVLFRGIDTGGASGLWMTDGTAAGTKKITDGTASTGINPTDITILNGAALFNGADAAGLLGLWATDGTGAGTQELTDIAGASTTGTGLNPSDMTVFENEVWFSGVDANGLTGLWVTDGSAPGTHELLDELSGADPTHGLSPTDLTVFGSELLFNGLDADGEKGLWVTDGTPEGTHEVYAGIGGATDPSGLNPHNMTVFNGKVFFNGADKFGREQLWETDGTMAGTQMLTVANTNGLSPSSFEVYNGQLVFSAYNNVGFQGLWTTDGTGPGTHEIEPISGKYSFGLRASNLTALTPEVANNILFQSANGQAAVLVMNGNAIVGGGAVNLNPDPSWTTIGTGDFNGDHHSDILSQNTSSGQVSIWDMNGNNMLGGGVVSPNPGPSWKAIGTGDFNHDGLSDILWRNTNTGQASIWEMHGNTLVGGGPVSPNPGPNWQAVGTGDFNHDGLSDILWRNSSSGQVSIWEMNGNALIGGGPVNPNPGPAWQAIGAGDFNHDGKSDILWQNATSGQISVWEMDGNALIGGGPVSANPGPSWHAIGTGGGSDILLQNTSGQTSLWEMNGNAIVGGGPVSSNLGSSWRAVGLG